MQLAVFLFFFLLSTASIGQTIEITVESANQPIELQQTRYSTVLRDSITWENMLFYLSDIQLSYQGNRTCKDDRKHRLIDLENQHSLTWSIPCNEAFDSISFIIGIDSITQMGGAMGQDLDPVHGMYWTWQSGYIHVKLEGRSPLFQSRNQHFQYHLGGYRWPWNSIQYISLPVRQRDTIRITVHIDTLLRQFNPHAEYGIMSPGERAVVLSKWFASCFTID